MVYAIVALSVIGLRETMPHGSDSIWISQNFVDFKRWEDSRDLCPDVNWLVRNAIQHIVVS